MNVPPTCMYSNCSTEAIQEMTPCLTTLVPSLVPSPPSQLLSLAVLNSVLFALRATIAVVEDWERGYLVPLTETKDRNRITHPLATTFHH